MTLPLLDIPLVHLAALLRTIRSNAASPNSSPAHCNSSPGATPCGRKGSRNWVSLLCQEWA